MIMMKNILNNIKKSIATKVNLVVITTIVTIIIISGIISYIFESNKLYKDVIKTSDQIAKRLENSLIQHAWEYNFDQINLIITLEMEYPYIDAILFSNLYGLIEAGKIKDKNGNIINYSAALKTDKELNKCFKIIEVPIKEDNFTLGKIFIYVSDKLLKIELLGIILDTFFQITFISIVLAVIVIVSLRKIVLNNVLLLDDAVQKFSKKDFNIRAPIILDDELGRLAGNFNKMADIISEYSKDMEDKVHERTIQLEKANEQKTNFFINLAHETKTPLTLISNYLDEYLKKSNDSYELDIIKNNIDKLRRDMVNFLDIEKLERGQLFYDHNQNINLSQVLKIKILLFREIANKKKIKLIEEISGEDLFIKIDPYAIDRVINNLLDNAIRYTDQEGEIKIILKNYNESDIEFTVIDNGVGISEEKQKHIFESYYQISHKKRNIQGIGVGLSIVKKIIDQVNGVIKIASKINNGTSLSIFFKRYNLSDLDIVEKEIECSKPIKNIESYNVKEESYKKGRYNIFIIEDNIELSEYLQTRMESIYNVFLARNGLEALKKLEYIPKPNVIISDILMDVMDGYDFYTEVLKDERFKDIPLIFLTAKTTLDEKIEGLSKGAIDYLYKPFYINELLVKINSIIRNQEVIRESNISEMENKIAKALRIELGDVGYNELNDKCSKYNITLKEKEIINFLINGFEYKEISEKLNSPTNTIKKRIHTIYKKLDIHNKVELIKMMN